MKIFYNLKINYLYNSKSTLEVEIDEDAIDEDDIPNN